MRALSEFITRLSKRARAVYRDGITPPRLKSSFQQQQIKHSKYCWQIWSQAQVRKHSNSLITEQNSGNRAPAVVFPVKGWCGPSLDQDTSALNLRPFRLTNFLALFSRVWPIWGRWGLVISSSYYNTCQLVNHVVLPPSRPGYHSLYIQLDSPLLEPQSSPIFTTGNMTLFCII
jgi:hypothetical protein